MAEAAAGRRRCLSDLSDDLLRHILFLAPDREGTSTAVLSRRWRWLWRTSGAVFLDSSSFTGECSGSTADEERESFLRGVEKALAAAATVGPIRRLTFTAAKVSRTNTMQHNLMEALLSNPAAPRVEELKIIVPRLTISLGSLPSSEALRVLHLIGCSILTAPPPPPGGAVVFPMLVELHLQRCSVSLVDFQTIVDAAPRLSTLHLTSSTFLEEDTIDDDDDEQLIYDDGGDDDEQPIDDDADDDDDEQPTDENDNDEQLYNGGDEKVFGLLLIPAVTALVVADCRYGYDQASLELDVPMLQYFSYRGHVQQAKRLLLKSLASASNMIQVDLHLTSDYHAYIHHPAESCDSFWQFIQNFNTTKRLKLKLDFTVDHLALEDKAVQEDLLGGLSFYLLDQLELEAAYKPGFERTSMVMLANLLHSCHMVRDLRLKLTKRHEMPRIESSINKEAGVHFDRSVNGFRNRRRPTVLLGGNDDDSYYQAFTIVPCLAGEHSFSCLQNHLKRVSLQFCMDEPNCLGVQLAKFFAENAMVLEEIHIDDGCHEMLEHINPTVRRLIAKTDKGSKLKNVKDY